MTASDMSRLPKPYKPEDTGGWKSHSIRLAARIRELEDALRFVERRFLHRGPNGQQCECEDCERVRAAL